jgi:hypothetical protein
MAMRNYRIPLTVLGLVSAFASCTGPDPAAIEFKDRIPLSSSGSISTSGGSGGGSSSSSGTSSGDGGTSGDGGVDPNSPFDGTYQDMTGANPHPPGGTSSVMLTKDTVCLDCHQNGPNPPKLTAGGVVFTDNTRATRAAKYEVWIKGANGVKTKINSAPNGGFAFTQAITFPAYVGVRSPNGATVRMNGPISKGSCSGGSCHEGTPLYGK